jgi:hypothetical protein
MSTNDLAAQAFPIVIAEWPCKRGEIVRVALDQYNGLFTVNLRVWWRDSDGIFKPGRRGLTLAVQHLPALAGGFANALDRARVFGLIEPATNSRDRTGVARQRRYRQRHNGGVTA